MTPRLSPPDTDRIQRLLEVGMLAGGEREELENYLLRPQYGARSMEYNPYHELNDGDAATLRRINSILQNLIGAV